jgi:hypothetical protein
MIDPSSLRHRAVRPWLASRGLLLVGLSALPLVTLRPSPARAQEDSAAADTAAARTLAIEGLKLADLGNCPEAIDKLARAEKLHHAPIVLGRLGECLVGQGRIVEGTEALRKLLREPLPPNAIPALVRAHERAQSVFDTAKIKIAQLIIFVKTPAEGLVVTVDGQPLSSVLLGGERPTDPGDHVIEANAPGYFKASRQVTLGAGEKQEINLELQPDPQAAAAREQAAASGTGPAAGPGQGSAVAGTHPPGAATGRWSTSAPNRTGAYVSWAIGGAGLAAGGIFGFLALRQKSDLDDDCGESKVCTTTTSKGKLDSARLAGNISTVLFGVAGAGLALGTALYFTASSSNAETPPAAFRARPWVGFGSVGVDGQF